MLRAIVRHGGWFSVAAAAAVLIVGVLAATRLESATVGVVGAAAGVLVYAIVRTIVELVTLITDMLLPK